MDQPKKYFKNLKALPAHEREKVERTLDLFDDLDVEVRGFKNNTGLRCAEGCGKCCENPEVETTVLEVLPLAYALWESGAADDALQRITTSEEKGQCVFYQPDPKTAGNGRCSVYSWRPLVCRLFGFSVKNDKIGRAAIVTCPTMKSLCSQEYQAADRAVNEGLKAPRMQDLAMRALGIDPHLGKEQMPINQAVRSALERAGNYLTKMGAALFVAGAGPVAPDSFRPRGERKSNHCGRKKNSLCATRGH